MQKKKVKINILDFLIIAIVVLCVTGALLRGYMAKNDAKLNTQEVVVEFEIKNIQSESEKCFVEGSSVYLEDFECDFGTIYKMQPATKAKYYSQNTVLGRVDPSWCEDGSKIDLKGSIVCKGTMTANGGFKLDGSQYLAPGKPVGISVRSDIPISGTITITDITLKSEYNK